MGRGEGDSAPAGVGHLTPEMTGFPRRADRRTASKSVIATFLVIASMLALTVISAARTIKTGRYLKYTPVPPQNPRSRLLEMQRELTESAVF